MRIISGTARGRKLHTPPPRSNAIRPTTDRAREALFSIIGPDIVGSHILDLCAGTGAFGCESLSRGAASVIFVDNAKTSLNLIAQNVAVIHDGPSRSSIVRHDLYKGLDHPSLTKAATDKFDIVFADPPYLTPLSEVLLSSLDNCRILADNPLVIFEEQKRFTAPERMNRFQITDTRTYGDSTFSFYRLKETNL